MCKRGRASTTLARPTAGLQRCTKSRTCVYTVLFWYRLLWLRQAVWVFVAPLRGTLLSGLMISSHGDHQVP